MELVANTESAGFDIYVSSDKKLYFDIMPSSSSSYSTINSSSSSSLSADTWYVVVGTYDGTTQKLYLNGTLVASKSLSGSIKTSTTPIYIGADQVLMVLLIIYLWVQLVMLLLLKMLLP